MPMYICADENGDAEIKASSAEEAAEKWVSAFDASAETQFFSVEVAPAPRKVKGKRPWPHRDDWESHDVVRHPSPPKCKRGKHDWEDGQVFGNGGGIAYIDTCRKCGLQKYYTNWGQNRENGSQGHDYYCYTPQGR